MSADLVSKLTFEAANPNNYFKNFERLIDILGWTPEKRVKVAVLQIGLSEEWLAPLS